MAQLYFKYGAMGSSKTANALMARFNYEERGQKTLLVKPRLDQRDQSLLNNLSYRSSCNDDSLHESHTSSCCSTLMFFHKFIQFFLKIWG